MGAAFNSPAIVAQAADGVRLQSEGLSRLGEADRLGEATVIDGWVGAED